MSDCHYTVHVPVHTDLYICTYKGHILPDIFQFRLCIKAIAEQRQAIIYIIYVYAP